MYLKVMQDEPLAQRYVKDESVFSLAALESKLVSYVNDAEASQTPFDATSVPKVSRAQAQQESALPSSLEASVAPVTAKTPVAAPTQKTAAETQSAYAQQLAAVSDFAEYGPVLSSSNKPAQLTESETEYVVSCVKHIFKEHVIFQFNVSNTLPDTVLERVAVAMQPNDVGLTEDFILPIASLSHTTSPQIVYVSFTRDSPADYILGSFACTLKFISKEVDPTSGIPEEEGYEDEYQLEEVELGAGSEYIVPNYANFSTEWDKLKDGTSLTDIFALSSMGSLKAACDSLVEILNMEALGGTENPTSTSVHTLNLSGLVTGGGGKVLARCRMTFSSGQGVTLELSVRAEQEAAARLVIAAIGG